MEDLVVIGQTISARIKQVTPEFFGFTLDARSSKLKEAPSHKKTIFEYAPHSHGAEDYAEAVRWVEAATKRAPASRPRPNTEHLASRAAAR